MRKSLVGSWEFGVRRRNRSAPNSGLQTHYLLAIVALCALSLSGCVRVAGTAGYWHTNPEGGTTAKQAGFDTAEYIPGSPPPGNITTS